ncbi:Chromosome partition protein Smc [bacterium HR34]|nr:Chromosome partition protein Smc [bacterium HR34]
MNKKFLITTILVLFILGVVRLDSFVLSQTQEDKIKEKEKLEAELKELEKQIQEYEKNINITEQQKKNLLNKIYSLKKEIEKISEEIEEGKSIVQNLSIQIEDTQKSIDGMKRKIELYQERIKILLNKIYQKEQDSLIEIMFNDGISSLFNEIENFESLNKKIYEFLSTIKTLKDDLQEQKTNLESLKEEHEKNVILNQLKAQERERIKKEQELALKQTQEKQLTYKQQLEEAKKRAQEIRNRIFELSGISKAPTFGEAYEIAKYVEQITGVRPAFLLAILTQESNIGRNVGECYLKDPQTGGGIRVKTGQWIDRVMKPSRDIGPFLDITKKVGRDPYSTVVSCPMSFGWGGAMGPAQFIPSTWVLYEDRISSITGKPADPWNIRDSFLAAGLYLADAGAAKRTYEDEWRAALIYFAGWMNLRYSFYADSVMKIVKQYEKDIADLEKAQQN